MEDRELYLLRDKLCSDSLEYLREMEPPVELWLKDNKDLFNYISYGDGILSEADAHLDGVHYLHISLFHAEYSRLMQQTEVLYTAYR